MNKQQIELENKLLVFMLYGKDNFLLNNYNNIFIEFFSSKENQIIYKSILSLISEHKKIDKIFIIKKIKEFNEFVEPALNKLTELFTMLDCSINHNTSINSDKFVNIYDYQLGLDYIEELSKLAEKNRILLVCNSIISANNENKNKNNIENIKKILSDNDIIILPKYVKEINETKSLEQAYNQRANELKNGNTIKICKTGIKNVDKTLMITGGNIYIIGARPAMGKTAFALTVSYNMAKDNKNIMFFSLEMPEHELLDRYSSLIIGKDNSVNIDLCEETYSKITLEKYNKVIEKNEYCINNIMLSYATSIDDIISNFYRVNQLKKIDCIFIDYLTLIVKKNEKLNQVQIIGEISRELKNLAIRFNIPIILIAQLNRSCELREDKRPMMSDLRDSGAIEQDASGILFLYRDFYYNAENSPYGEKVAELIIAKNRQGSIGKTFIKFIPEKTTFNDIEDDELNTYKNIAFDENSVKKKHKSYGN